MRNSFLFLSFAVLTLLSCEKKVDSPLSAEQADEVGVGKRDLSSYKLAFARVLSKAVVKEKDLRRFLKEEALEMKDNDFDVIVAFCKDDLIKNKNKTFKEVLVEYEEYPGQVDEIIYEVPTVTVLVPDLFGEFHAASWDTESEELFVATAVGDQIPVIYDGEEFFALSNNEMPGEPTLFVKTNERIRLKNSPQLLASTKPKLNSASFEFVNEAFDGMPKPVVTPMARRGRGGDARHRV